MNPTQELDKAERLVSEIDEIEDLEGSLDSDPVAQRRLRRLRRQMLDWVPSVRLSVAASLLELSVPTVRNWTERGLLQELDTSPRRVTLESLLEVRLILRELRSLGKDRDLVEAVRARVEDQRALADPDLQRSLEELDRGELIEVTPLSRRELPS